MRPQTSTISLKLNVADELLVTADIVVVSRVNVKIRVFVTAAAMYSSVSFTGHIADAVADAKHLEACAYVEFKLTL